MSMTQYVRHHFLEVAIYVDVLFGVAFLGAQIWLRPPPSALLIGGITLCVVSLLLFGFQIREILRSRRAGMLRP